MNGEKKKYCKRTILTTNFLVCNHISTMISSKKMVPPGFEPGTLTTWKLCDKPTTPWNHTEINEINKDINRINKINKRNNKIYCSFLKWYSIHSRRRGRRRRFFFDCLHLFPILIAVYVDFGIERVPRFYQKKRKKRKEKGTIQREITNLMNRWNEQINK